MGDNDVSISPSDCQDIGGDVVCSGDGSCVCDAPATYD